MILDILSIFYDDQSFCPPTKWRIICYQIPIELNCWTEPQKQHDTTSHRWCHRLPPIFHGTKNKVKAIHWYTAVDCSKNMTVFLTFVPTWRLTMLFISLKLVLTDANMVTLNLICKVNISILLPMVGFKPMLIFKSMFHNVRLIREETMIESYESVGDINLLVKIRIRCSISTQQLCFRRGIISFKRRITSL